MDAHRGYLSLIQYSPDPLRFEAVNVGVVLLDPLAGRMELKTAGKLHRAKKTFEWIGADTWSLQQTIGGVWASLNQQYRLGLVKDSATLRTFGEALGGSIRLAPPRAVAIRDFDVTLVEVFNHLVRVPGEEKSSDHATQLPVAQPLVDSFITLSSRLKNVGIGRSFPIEGLGYSVRSDYDYRNGTANLVRLLKVTFGRPKAAVKQAIELGGESVQVGKHLRIDDLKAKLIVVLAPVDLSQPINKIEDEIGRLSPDYPDAEYILSSAIPDFAHRVLADAK